MKKSIVLLGIISTLVSCTSTVSKETNSGEKQVQTTTKLNTMNTSIYNHNYQTPAGETKSFDQFTDKVILIVNTATKCGLTPQFEGLELLHNTYSDKGLKVIGFPCNQFGGQEPLTNEEMVETCKINHGVTFELAKKIEVNGENENSLYTFLKSEQKLEENNDIRWNFEKFLVNRKGEIVKRFAPQTTPAEITAEIEGLL